MVTRKKQMSFDSLPIGSRFMYYRTRYVKTANDEAVYIPYVRYPKSRGGHKRKFQSSARVVI